MYFYQKFEIKESPFKKKETKPNFVLVENKEVV